MPPQFLLGGNFCALSHGGDVIIREFEIRNEVFDPLFIIGWHVFIW